MTLTQRISIAMLFLAALNLYGSAVANASDHGRFTGYGSGQKSCASFIDASNSSDGGLPFTGWLAGYLSAFNHERDGIDDVLEGSDFKGAQGWLRNYCLQHPTDSFSRGVEELVNFLIRKRKAEATSKTNDRLEAASAGIQRVTASSVKGQRLAPHLVLERRCDELMLISRGYCRVFVKIDGAITKADADAFRKILDEEALRTGKKVSPSVKISSQGGDVEAAMLIGRDLRRTEGSLDTVGPCYSACVLVAAGAVQRVAWNIGIHRPYFADATTGNFAEADERYKKMMAQVHAYLTEMNLPDEIFQVMQSVGPAEIRKLSQNDSMRLGFIGDDPAYEEARIAAEARRYGLNSAEYRARQEKTGATCLQQLGTLPTDLAADLEYHRQCGRIKDAIMWGTDVETARRIEDAVVQHCAGPIETPDWDACMKEVGQAIKVGQPLSPPKPLVPMAHPLPPGFEYVDK